MLPAHRLASTLLLIAVIASACSASIEQSRPLAADPVQVAVAEFVATHPFRNQEPVELDVAECIGTRLVGRVGREQLAVVGLTEPAETESFFQASVLWPREVGSTFDRVVTGCTRHLEVRSSGATYAQRIANAYVVPSFGEEFCLGEWLLASGLDPNTAPLPADATDLESADDEQAAAVEIAAEAVGACLGMGRAVLTVYHAGSSLRPASVDCLLSRDSDLSFRSLIALSSAIPGPEPAEAEALVAYLTDCMTDQEVVTMVGVS